MIKVNTHVLIFLLQLSLFPIDYFMIVEWMTFQNVPNIANCTKLVIH